MQQQKPLLEETIKLQQIASNPANSVFVSASAGSGKTKILTNRVLRLLLTEIDPSKILCLTFTKVAAAEMQNRIYNEVASWVSMTKENLQIKLFEIEGIQPSEHKIKQARIIFAKLLEGDKGLKISTIHSFCQSLMRQFPIEAQLSPNFEVIDDKTGTQLLLQARNELLKNAVSDSILADKIQSITAKLNENSFSEIISELINKRERLISLKEKYLDDEIISAKIYQILGCKINDKEEDLLEEFFLNLNKNDFFELAQILEKSLSKSDLENSRAIINYLNDSSVNNFNFYKEIFINKSDGSSSKRLITKKIAEKNPKLEEILLKEQNRIINFVNRLSSLRIAESSSELISIAYKMLDIYSKLKQQKGYVDYNDLITKTANLLTNSNNSSWIKYKLDGNFEHILIDESQDTNHYQWNIIKAVTEDFFSGQTAVDNNRTIFVVGDEKQSIYSFQGSDPSIFSDIYFYYQEKLSSINSELKDIKLDNSFRSLPAILETVDLVFSGSEYEKAISKLKKVNHLAIRNSHFGKVEVWPIISAESKNKAENKDDFSWKLNFEPSKEYKSKELLAKNIVKTIKNWISEKRILPSKKRPIQYGDITILLKNRTNNLGNLLVKFFREEQIPVSGNDRIEITKHIIVQDLLALAKFILLKEDDLNLACLLKSPLINISEEQLMELCLIKNNKNITLFESLKSSNLAEKYLYLSDVLTKNNLSTYQLFSYILESKNGREKILKRFGKESEEIINQFLNICLQHDQSKFPSLGSLVNDLENLDLKIKIDVDNGEFDEVKISTIHSAKGLEAPIIFLADSAHSLQNIYSDSNKIIWHGDFPLWNSGENNDFIKSIKKEERELDNEEYWRLLYVAMTRAADELYITGFDGKISPNCWYNVIYESIKNKTIIKNSEFGEILTIYKKEEESNNYNQNYSEKIKETINIPEFIKQIPPKETKQETIYPSKILNYKNFQFKFDNQINLGKIIHKILEIAVNNKSKSDDERKILIEKYLKDKFALNQAQQNSMMNQVLNILENENFKEIIKKDCQTEVPITGEIDGKIISGKIDLLVTEEHKITIIDYKTNINQENPENLANKYKIQLDLYKQILQKIYPKKEIQGLLMWI